MTGEGYCPWHDGASHGHIPAPASAVAVTASSDWALAAHIVSLSSPGCVATCRDDPNSGAASFSVTLGPAPHLDMHYTVFG